MVTVAEQPNLADLAFEPYLDHGAISNRLIKQIGIYGIFDAEQTLQYVGYSRDIYLSLKQHLVLQPQHCHWLKVHTITRPSRSLLLEIQNAWIEENGFLPLGNGESGQQWTDAIDAKMSMTNADFAAYAEADERGKEKVYKNVARRLEAQIKERLEARGVTMDIRFNPKLKNKGLLHAQ
ncbi:MAG: GIY-YIG nuclease family protein [Cyanobacteria bacterium P01_H01_bin.15]